MKVVYVTAFSFPSAKAEPYHVKSLVSALTEHIGKDLLFVINGPIPPELEGIQTQSIKRIKRFRALFYFFWFPYFVYQERLKTNDIVFISNDPFILLVFIFWKKIFRFTYRICADWHLLFDDWKDSVIMRNSDYVVATTQRLKDVTVSKCGIKAEKVLVAYGGVDQDLLVKQENIPKNEIRATLGLPVDAFLIGYVGTFRGRDCEKGLTTMIKALPNLPSHMQMAFVGGTREQIPEYEALANTLGIRNRCHFFEKQPFKKIITYESVMDILVIPYPDHPHFRDYGFPIKVWEYMASGRPIVYSDLEVIAEVLKGKGTSFVPDSPSSLVEAILSIYNNRENVEHMAKRNIDDVASYTWSKKALRILNFFSHTVETDASKKI